MSTSASVALVSTLFGPIIPYSRLAHMRLVHHDESMKRGYVTKTTTLSGIVDWNQRCGRLLVKHISGDVTYHILDFDKPNGPGALRYFRNNIFWSELEATGTSVEIEASSIALADDLAHEKSLIVSGITTQGTKCLARVGDNGKIKWVGCFPAISVPFRDDPWSNAPG